MVQCHAGILELALNKLYQELQRPGVAAQCVCCGCFAAFFCPDCFTFLFFSNISVFCRVHQVRLYTLALILIGSGQDISPGTS